MSEPILVFKEQDYFFGVSPIDFVQQYSLDQVEIAPSGVSNAIWHYQTKQKKNPIEGIFLHVGALFGLYPVDFNYSGQIFIMEINKEVSLGLFLDHLTFKIPADRIDLHYSEVTDINKLPPELPPRAIVQVAVYNRKKIFMIDPVRLSEVYQFIAPERIVNLMRSFYKED